MLWICNATTCVQGNAPLPFLPWMLTKMPRFWRSISSAAERAGFEPAVPLPVRQFSKLFLSASQASLRTGRKGKTSLYFSKGNFFGSGLFLIPIAGFVAGRMNYQRKPSPQRIDPEFLHHHKTLLMQLTVKFLPVLK